MPETTTHELDVATSGLFSVRGKAAVVTGASSGLGERWARLLAANGADVLAVARRTDRLDALCADNPGVVALQADLGEEVGRADVIGAAIERFGRLDILVNNAGYGVPAPAVDEALDSFRRVLEVNLIAVFELSRTAARHMIAAGSGSIINIASMYGLVSSAPIPNASYTASKGAVVNLTRDLACQWARSGVRVNAIAPGFFPTEATDGLESGSAQDWVRRNCPAGRIGRPDELDGVLLFLASDASTYCNGHTLVVDGGWTAR
ncbi:MAG: SDR family oxidoreductase [Ilumatobacteraceae bacterium]